MSNSEIVQVPPQDAEICCNSLAGGAGGRRRRLGDGVPWPEREVPSLPSLFPRLPPQRHKKDT